VGFCTDDRNPLDIAQEGHIDHLVRSAIREGVCMEAAYRSSSWTVARHYGLLDRGALAPGYRADLVLLGDPKQCEIEKVWLEGNLVDELSGKTSTVKRPVNSVNAKAPTAKELEGPTGRVHVIGVEPGKILTRRHVLDSKAEGVAHLTVLERHGKRSPPANAYALGFGKKFRGALASSVGHDSHNLIGVGSSTEDMAVAFRALIESGGGYCAVDKKEVKALLPLPFGGLMSLQPAHVLEKALLHLRRVCRAQGCELEEPFLQLAFLSLPVIPDLKLTDLGLFDVNAFRLVPAIASWRQFSLVFFMQLSQERDERRLHQTAPDPLISNLESPAN
jgi:adenine deaminase